MNLSPKPSGEHSSATNSETALYGGKRNEAQGKADFSVKRQMSAFGGKADIGLTPLNVCF